MDVRARCTGRVGVLMSGGLDSASVAALAARSRGDVLACSGMFPEHPEVDESQLITTLVSELRVDSLTAAVKPGGLVASVFESPPLCAPTARVG